MVQEWVGGRYDPDRIEAEVKRVLPLYVEPTENPGFDTLRTQPTDFSDKVLSAFQTVFDIRTARYGAGNI